MSVTRLVLQAVVLTATFTGLSADAQRQCADEAATATADALAAKFDDHQFVFIGSTHGDVKIEKFLSCVITRPAFTRRATDIVVEWAGSGHQSMLDRYILALHLIRGRSLAFCSESSHQYALEPEDADRKPAFPE